MRPEFRANFATKNLFETLRTDVPWINVGNAPRNECFMAIDTSRTYSYGKQARSRTYTASEMIPEVKDLMSMLNDVYNCHYNICVLNSYADEHQHLGWHADDSPEQDPNHPIAVVSFGAEREIWIKPRLAKGNVPDEDKFLLTQGSLFIMPPGFQDDWVHKIPKHSRPCGQRISLTYRKLDR